jgi:hypothetical protein
MREFVDEDLAGARFVRTDLSGAVMRAVDIGGADIDAPWLLEGSGATLVVNGVDVAPYVEDELNRRFPGRSDRRATEPDALREAWAACRTAWDAAVAGVDPAVVDVQVAGEFSFAQTLRHLVMATDVWFRGAVLEIEQPLHPIGQPHAEYATDGFDTSVFSEPSPSYARVLEVRAEHVAMVTDFLATATAEDLAVLRKHPWGDLQVPTLNCVHTILEEEWEHLRYALRDLEVIGR